MHVRSFNSIYIRPPLRLRLNPFSTCPTLPAHCSPLWKAGMPGCCKVHGWHTVYVTSVASRQQVGGAAGSHHSGAAVSEPLRLFRGLPSLPRTQAPPPTIHGRRLEAAGTGSKGHFSQEFGRLANAPVCCCRKMFPSCPRQELMTMPLYVDVVNICNNFGSFLDAKASTSSDSFRFWG